jgi:hypothetical protein
MEDGWGNGHRGGGVGGSRHRDSRCWSWGGDGRMDRVRSYATVLAG